MRIVPCRVDRRDKDNNENNNIMKETLFDNFIITVPSRIVMSWEASVPDDGTRRTGNRKLPVNRRLQK